MVDKGRRGMNSMLSEKPTRARETGRSGVSLPGDFSGLPSTMLGIGHSRYLTIHVTIQQSVEAADLGTNHGDS